MPWLFMNYKALRRGRAAHHTRTPVDNRVHRLALPPSQPPQGRPPTQPAGTVTHVRPAFLGRPASSLWGLRWALWQKCWVTLDKPPRFLGLSFPPR